MEKEVFLWLGLMILFLVVELATVGLTSIWLAGGAVVRHYLVALAGATVAGSVLRLSWYQFCS